MNTLKDFERHVSEYVRVRSCGVFGNTDSYSYHYWADVYKQGVYLLVRYNPRSKLFFCNHGQRQVSRFNLNSPSGYRVKHLTLKSGIYPRIVDCLFEIF